MQRESCKENLEEKLMASQDRSELLATAIRSGDIDMVRTLVAEKAHLNWGYGDTPLSLAAEEGQLEVVRLLLDAGVPVDEEDEEDGDFGSNRTALTAAATNGHLEVAGLLVQRGADVHHESAPLINAVSDLAMVQFLIEAGANPAQEDEEGRPAIAYASEQGHPEVVQFLAEAAGWEQNEDMEELLKTAREVAQEGDDDEDD
jgi:ankyrin repeat protein